MYLIGLRQELNKMEERKLPENFWYDHVAKGIAGADLPPHIWDRICKVRNTPIKLVRDVIVGDTRRPYTVVPKGCRGYIIDYPEVFYLSADALECIANHPNYLPAVFIGSEEVFLLIDDDYEIEPFFDMDVANFAAEYIEQND